VSIVNALYRLRITDQLFKSYGLHEWCVHNRLSNAYYEVKSKKTPDIRQVGLFCLLLTRSLKLKYICTPFKVTMYTMYWVIQNDCGQVWQLCKKIYLATVWVG
jgi:hypothetical protein